jgi:hypothetical protein
VSAARGVLINGEEGRNTFAFLINTPQQEARTLRCDHHNVDIGGRNDSFEMNAEAVREAESLAGMKKWLNCRFIKGGLGLIGRKNMDPIAAFGSLRRTHDYHAILSRLLRRATIRIKADDDFVSAVAQVLRLGMSLATVAEDRDSFALQGGGIGIVFIKDLGGHSVLLENVSLYTTNRPVGRFPISYGFLGWCVNLKKGLPTGQTQKADTRYRNGRWSLACGRWPVVVGLGRSRQAA